MESSSEDEVFVGGITEREMNHPSFNSRRRTTIYFPGISRPDANISVHKETTDDGTLLFSFENMEESGSEGNAVNRSEQMSESLTLKSKSELSETETGTLSERDGIRWLSSQAHSSRESDMDSGFSSVSDGSSVSTIISSSSLTSEEPDFLPNTEVKQKITKDAYRYICSETDTVYLQSPRQSVKPLADSLDLGASAINRDANCSEAFSIESMGSTVSATTTAAAAAVTQTAVHTGTGAFSELTITSPKCDQSSAPAVSGVVKDFPACHSVSGFMSPTAKTYHRTLPLKRKIARKSPALELETDCKMESSSDTNGFRVQQGKCSPVSTFSNYGDTSDYYSFDIFHASRKLQKLDLGCDRSPEIEHSKTLSTLDRKMFAGGDADVTPKQSSTAPRVLAPETPNLKMSAITDSSHGYLPSSAEGFVQTNPNDESEIIPSSQGTGNDFSPNVCREVGAVTAEVKGSKARIDSSRTAPLTPLFANKCSTNMDQSCTLSPDLFSSPCLEKSTRPVTSTQGPILSPRPGSASTCINSPKPPLQPLQPIQEGKGLGRSSKYGRLPMRKPMKTKRESKENMEEEPVSGLSWSSFSFSFVQTNSLPESPLSVEEESRAAMTRINTVINGEIRHVLKDLQSSPSRLTHFPPPREATRVSWSENLVEEPVVSLSPTRTPVAPRSILQQRPVDFEYPFTEEPPSPIVLTRRRSPKFPRLFSFDS